MCATTHAMETSSSTAAVEAPTPTTVETTASTTAAVKASASATVTAVLCERQIWYQSQSRESRKRDEGFRQTKFTHNLSFHSSGTAHARSHPDARVAQARKPPLERMHLEFQLSWESRRFH
jgi:hypothetical protein